MRKEIADLIHAEGAEPASTGEQPEGDAPDITQPVHTVERRPETWPHDDIRLLVRAGGMLRHRNVDLLLMCATCHQTLKLEGRDDGGASLMGCGCVVRRWL